jgi:hypothetical protein
MDANRFFISSSVFKIPSWISLANLNLSLTTLNSSNSFKYGVISVKIIVPDKMLVVSVIVTPFAFKNPLNVNTSVVFFAM